MAPAEQAICTIWHFDFALISLSIAKAQILTWICNAQAQITHTTSIINKNWKSSINQICYCFNDCCHNWIDNRDIDFTGGILSNKIYCHTIKLKKKKHELEISKVLSKSTYTRHKETIILLELLLLLLSLTLHIQCKKKMK